MENRSFLLAPGPRPSPRFCTPDDVFAQDPGRLWPPRDSGLTSRRSRSTHPSTIRKSGARGSRTSGARSARQEESEQGGSFYDLVYRAARPELFFKATPSRVVGPNQPIRVRRDSDGAFPSRSWPW